MNITDIRPKAMRLDQGKTRHDLVPPFPQELYAQVLTFGAQKYEAHQWRQGMAWSKCIGALKRHILAFEKGEDIDPESGIPHPAHIMCNAAFLTEYMKTYPEGDDRWRMPKSTYGLDIDEVLADFTTSYCRRFDVQHPSSWNFDTGFEERYESLFKDEDFWMNLNMITPPEVLPDEPRAYITARPECLREITHYWLSAMGYPTAPIIHTNDKLKACNDLGIEIFVDDKYHTMNKLNKNGVLCYLFDSPQNKRYNVGWKRITPLTIKNILL